jgi:hypothetical protein
MKEQIIGYVTALVDTNSGTINQSMVRCLNNLLEYVIDIPEESKEVSILNFNLSLENENLKQSNAKLLNRVMELEESCENMNEVEINLHKRVQALIDNNETLDNNCNVLMDHNNKLIKANFGFAKCNKNQVQMIIKLKHENELLTK